MNGVSDLARTNFTANVTLCKPHPSISKVERALIARLRWEETEMLYCMLDVLIIKQVVGMVLAEKVAKSPSSTFFSRVSHVISGRPVFSTREIADFRWSLL